MKKLLVILVCILPFLPNRLQAAGNDTIAVQANEPPAPAPTDEQPALRENSEVQKSVAAATEQANEQPAILLTDTTTVVPAVAEEEIILVGWKPDPMKSVWLGAIVPGLGQIYNRKYWKLPIIYGGFLGCAYAISWNNGMYQDYKNAYRDIIDNDPNTNSFLDILPEGYTIESLGGTSAYTNVLRTRVNTYRRYRDLSIALTVGVYALTLIDAYVDAQLYDFDISPDLSLNLQPVIYKDENNKHAAELVLTLRF